MKNKSIFSYDWMYSLHDMKMKNCSIINNLILFLLGSTHDDDLICDYNAIAITVDGLHLGEEYEHISITVCKKGSMKDISFGDFIALLKTNEMDIYMDYYSKFSRSMILKGTINKKFMYIEIAISEIIDISFIKDEKCISSFSLE